MVPQPGGCDTGVEVVTWLEGSRTTLVLLEEEEDSAAFEITLDVDVDASVDPVQGHSSGLAIVTAGLGPVQLAVFDEAGLRLGRRAVAIDEDGALIVGACGRHPGPCPIRGR